jgi:hypothetical protein
MLKKFVYDPVDDCFVVMNIENYQVIGKYSSSQKTYEILKAIKNLESVRNVEYDPKTQEWIIYALTTLNFVESKQVSITFDKVDVQNGLVVYRAKRKRKPGPKPKTQSVQQKAEDKKSVEKQEKSEDKSKEKSIEKTKGRRHRK